MTYFTIVIQINISTCNSEEWHFILGFHNYQENIENQYQFHEKKPEPNPNKFLL